jgi:hypothetical protein
MPAIAERLQFTRSGHITVAASAYLHAKGKKFCPGCRRILPFSSFSLTRSVSDGFAGYCRGCKAKLRRKSTQRLADARDDSAQARFLGKLKKIPTGCWIWRGALDDNGHGAFTYQGRGVMAHIAGRHIFGYKVPKGLVSYQTCKVPPCCNPDHVAFCTRRELSLEHSRENPFSRNARQELCFRRVHRLVDGVNVYWIVNSDGKLGISKGLSRICLDCWRAAYPGTKRTPNTRADAQGERERRLSEMFSSHIPRNAPAELRAAVLAELWARWKDHRATRRSLPRIAREVFRAEWRLQPDRLGAPLSLDAEILGTEGLRLVDGLRDGSEWSDPAIALERLEEEALSE